MQRVGIVVHPTRYVEDAVEDLERWTRERGLELVQVAAGDQPSLASAGEVGACDLIAALGGDGTVLKALHAAAKTGTPVLGVAYGSLGALTAVPENELHDALDRVAGGDWVAHHLPALEVSAAGVHLGWAINDLVLARRGSTQLMLDLSIDDDLYARLAGDGVVVATALGSSAYSMAAGGSLLTSGVDAFVCTPVAMHGGCAPPLVLPRDRTLTVQVHPGYGGFGIDIDGWQLHTDAERFQVRCEHAYAPLIGLSKSDGGIVRLRERGLIRDSPRVIAQDDRALQVRDGK